MLVLSRKKNESIMVGDVEITVVEIRGDKVRLGFVAPKEVPVHRKEVWEAIHVTPQLWDKLLPRLQAQRENRQKHDLAWRDPVELKEAPEVTLPKDDPEFSSLVLHVDPNISADALARAYRLPALPPGTWHAVEQRPSRPYLLILDRASTGEPAPMDPTHVIQAAEMRRWRGSPAQVPLLPLELLLLAIEQPEAFQDRGLTAAGAVNAEQRPAVERPSMYPVNIEQVQVAFRDAFQDAYFPSLVRLPDGAFRWVLHQGPHGGYGIPLARHIV